MIPETLPNIDVAISKDDSSYFVIVTCESLDMKVLKRFNDISTMSLAVEDAKKELGLDYKK